MTTIIKEDENTGRFYWVCRACGAKGGYRTSEEPVRAGSKFHREHSNCAGGTSQPLDRARKAVRPHTKKGAEPDLALELILKDLIVYARVHDLKFSFSIEGQEFHSEDKS